MEALAVGVMSGTSLDGVSTALVKLRDEPPDPPRAELIAFRQEPYTAAERGAIIDGIARGTPKDLAFLHVALGERFAGAVLSLLAQARLTPRDLTFVASHGQTIWHEPGRATLQLGDAAVLAERLGVRVVSDFRARDVAAGGQGAPLVPLADVMLFGHEQGGRWLLNLGGMANVTWVPRRGVTARAPAVDTGPGVAGIDAVTRKIDPHAAYDGGGDDRSGHRPLGNRSDGHVRGARDFWWWRQESRAHRAAGRQSPASSRRPVRAALLRRGGEGSRGLRLSRPRDRDGQAGQPAGRHGRAGPARLGTHHAGMIQPRARLVCPALRWRRGSFRSNRATIDAALAAGVGGFILFGGTRDAVAALTHGLQQRAGRPLLLGSDLERGAGQQVHGLTEFPPPGALGFLGDRDATYAAAAMTATEARAVGITWAFAPVCDLDVEPKNPIVQTRSFGADAQVVGRQAAAWIRGCQEHGVLACAKHFPGHGRTTTDSHEGLPVVEVPAAELQQTDCAPFAAAVRAGVGSVMPAHVAYPAWDSTGSAATFSKPILGYLRDTIRFDGLVVTDAFIMAGATAAAPEGVAAAAAVVAGCDMLLYPTDWAGGVSALEQVDADRAEHALARYGMAIRTWGTVPIPVVDDAMLAEHQKFADGRAART